MIVLNIDTGTFEIKDIGDVVDTRARVQIMANQLNYREEDIVGLMNRAYALGYNSRTPIPVKLN